MQKQIDEIILEVIKKLKQKFEDFYGVYLFKEDDEVDDEDSNEIELVAVFDEENKQKRESIWQIVGDIEKFFDVYIDLHPISKQTLMTDSYYKEVSEIGIFFNAKSL